MISTIELLMESLENSAGYLVAKLESQKKRIEMAAKTWNKGKKEKMELTIMSVFLTFDDEFVNLRKDIEEDDDGLFDMEPEYVERFEKVKETYNYAIILYKEVIKLANEKLGGGYGLTKPLKKFDL